MTTRLQVLVPQCHHSLVAWVAWMAWVAWVATLKVSEALPGIQVPVGSQSDPPPGFPLGSSSYSPLVHWNMQPGLLEDATECFVDLLGAASSDLQRLGDARPHNPPGTYNWKASSCPPKWSDLPHLSGDPPSPSGCGGDWSLQTWLARSVRIHLWSGLSPHKSHTSAKLLSYPQNHWSQSSAWNHSPRWDSGETSSATPRQIESSVVAPRPSINPHEHSVRRIEAIEWCQWKWNSRFPADSAGTPPLGQAHLDAFASIRAVSFVPVSVLRSTGLCAPSSQWRPRQLGPFAPFRTAWAWTPGIATPRSRSVAWEPNRPTGWQAWFDGTCGPWTHLEWWTIDFYMVEHQKHRTSPKILMVHDYPNLGRKDGYWWLLYSSHSWRAFPSALFSARCRSEKKPLAWPPDQSIG